MEGLLEFIPGTDQGRQEPYAINVVASDAFGGSTVLSLSITVRDQAPNPVIGSLAGVETSPGSVVDVALHLSDASGVGNFDAVLAYDADILQATEVAPSADIASFLVAPNLATPGRVLVSGATGQDPIAQGSTDFLLITVRFAVLADGPAETSVRLTELLLNDADFVAQPTERVHGVVSILNHSYPHTYRSWRRSRAVCCLLALDRSMCR